MDCFHTLHTYLALAGPTGLVPELRWAIGSLIVHCRVLLRELGPVLGVPLGFRAFLVANGGAVVVGDKQAHAPVK